MAEDELQAAGGEDLAVDAAAEAGGAEAQHLAGIGHTAGPVATGDGESALEVVADVVDVADATTGCAMGCGDVSGCLDGCSCGGSLMLGLCLLAPLVWHTAVWALHRR